MGFRRGLFDGTPFLHRRGPGIATRELGTHLAFLPRGSSATLELFHLAGPAVLPPALGLVVFVKLLRDSARGALLTGRLPSMSDRSHEVSLLTSGGWHSSTVSPEDQSSLLFQILNGPTKNIYVILGISQEAITARTQPTTKIIALMTM